ncbi:MAG: M23 family metallopeptidase [Anaerolineae bacterium]|nr:M23 family metallopeptidase [Anaerolineae bacterium]
MHGENPVNTSPRTRRGLLLIGALALALTVTAGVIFLWSDSDDHTPAPPIVSSAIPSALPSTTPSPAAAALEPTLSPTLLPTLPPTVTIPPLDWTHPTAGPDEIAAALDRPVQLIDGEDAIAREVDPLTISPVRTRDSVMTYTVQPGDNLGAIAARFGLDESTIIWSNDRFYVNAMRVGLELTILPVNGVYHRVIDPQPVAGIAELYSVDPYTIIDSEYNALFGTTSQTVLPAGLYVVVPGGQGTTEPVYWDPGIVIASGDPNSGATVGDSYASFGAGQDGSCGQQAVTGGSMPYSPPIHSTYSITQDFTWSHGGIDLAVPVGTGVFAAGGGTVIFSGWSDWGYGYTIVIAHGSTLTLYGHLNGMLVGCGQTVRAGQGIAVTGSSGNSSGPHLHFEIRGSDGRPVNPWNYQQF